jgi:nitroreductase
MEFSDVIAGRVSCRSYNGKQVEKADLDKILKVMELAPTAAHYQAYRVRVTTDLELIGKFAEITGQQDRFVGATAAIVFFAVPEEGAERFEDRSRKLYSVQDATLACAYAQLAAADLGIASLWVGSFDEVAVLEACELSRDGSDGLGLWPVAISLFGYTDKKLEHCERKPLDDLKV